MHTRSIDLNLLRTFHAVHAAGNVSRAAERLGVSQPTVSHALQRLRRIHGDPLFVRTQGGMTPTAKGQRLAEAVEQALTTLEVALRETETYDPARSDRTFRLHLTDIGETIFLPRLIGLLAREAPRVRIAAFQLDDADILSALESGRIDLALGYIPALSGAQRQFLLAERYVVAMRAGHPLAKRKPTRAALAQLSYALVRSHPATARALSDLGLAGRIGVELPHFMVLPRVLAETDLAAMMPWRLAQAFQAMGDYVVWQPRAGMPRFDVSVHWFWRFTHEPGSRWLRERIVALFGEPA
ncbi:MAG: LysR family transcriptional regulator [Burkholderiales bacterium]|nr:LysR family transcriptional regulator [Burkholderiales bacterium]